MSVAQETSIRDDSRSVFGGMPKCPKMFGPRNRSLALCSAADSTRTRRERKRVAAPDDVDTAGIRPEETGDLMRLPAPTSACRWATWRSRRFMSGVEALGHSHVPFFGAGSCGRGQGGGDRCPLAPPPAKWRPHGGSPRFDDSAEAPGAAGRSVCPLSVRLSVPKCRIRGRIESCPPWTWRSLCPCTVSAWSSTRGGRRPAMPPAPCTTGATPEESGAPRSTSGPRTSGVVADARKRRR